MDIKELMIGDLVTFKDCQNDERPMPIQIVGLGYQGKGTEDEALVCINRDKGCDIISIDDEIVGIPLTEELLLKNFPTTSFLAWWHFEDGFHCETCTNGDIMASGKFHYVHEVQHALALCGLSAYIDL